MTKLTPAQVRALRSMVESGHGKTCAHTAKVRMPTMWALVADKRAVPEGGPGDMFSPRTAKFLITPAGRAALAAHEGETK